MTSTVDDVIIIGVKCVQKNFLATVWLVIPQNLRTVILNGNVAFVWGLHLKPGGGGENFPIFFFSKFSTSAMSGDIFLASATRNPAAGAKTFRYFLFVFQNFRHRHRRGTSAGRRRPETRRWGRKFSDLFFVCFSKFSTSATSGDVWRVSATRKPAEGVTIFLSFFAVSRAARVVMRRHTSSSSVAANSSAAVCFEGCCPPFRCHFIRIR